MRIITGYKFESKQLKIAVKLPYLPSRKSFRKKYKLNRSSLQKLGVLGKGSTDGELIFFVSQREAVKAWKGYQKGISKASKVRVRGKGQLTIPVEIRERLGIMGDTYLGGFPNREGYYSRRG